MLLILFYLDKLTEELIRAVDSVCGLSSVWDIKRVLDL